jgi:hypothetical protein
MDLETKQYELKDGTSVIVKPSAEGWFWFIVNDPSGHTDSFKYVPHDNFVEGRFSLTKHNFEAIDYFKVNILNFGSGK